MCSASVDKFGHHISNRKIQTGPPGVGFKIDQNGNFDIDQRKLTNVKEPTENMDVVTIKYLQDNNYMFIPSDKYLSLQNKRVVKMEDPIDETDAVNKRYLKLMKKSLETEMRNNCIYAKEGESAIDMKNRHLINIPDPSKENDVITKKYFDQFKNNLDGEMMKKYLYIRDGERNIDIKNHHLINIPEPIKSTDVITKQYYDSYIAGINFTLNQQNLTISQLKSDLDNIKLLFN